MPAYTWGGLIPVLEPMPQPDRDAAPSCRYSAASGTFTFGDSGPSWRVAERGAADNVTLQQQCKSLSVTAASQGCEHLPADLLAAFTGLRSLSVSCGPGWSGDFEDECGPGTSPSWRAEPCMGRPKGRDKWGGACGLPEGFLAHTRALTRLDVRACQGPVPKIPEGTPLKHLSVAQAAGFVTWDEAILSGPHELEHITLDSNPDLAEIREGAFKDLTALKTLYINRNPRLRELPGSLFTDAAAASLERVQILGNGITAVTPGWLNGCGRLTELSLDRNRIRALPDRTFEGALSLPELRLFLNDITKVDRLAFHGLESMTHLYLSFNPIASLHKDAFKDLTALWNLWMAGLKLTALSPGLFDGPSETLQRLSLEDYSPPLRRLPGDLFRKGLPALTSLRLASQDIQTLPNDFLHGLPALTKFDISKNRSFRMPNGFFDKNPHLEKLYLYETIFPEELTAEMFGTEPKLKRLRRLRMEKNGIRRIGPNAFASMPELTRLELQANELTEIAEGAFNGVRNLQELNLQGNYLTSLPADFTRTDIKYLRLRQVALWQRARRKDGRECLVLPTYAEEVKNTKWSLTGSVKVLPAWEAGGGGPGARLLWEPCEGGEGSFTFLTSLPPAPGAPSQGLSLGAFLEGRRSQTSGLSTGGFVVACVAGGTFVYIRNCARRRRPRRRL